METTEVTVQPKKKRGTVAVQCAIDVHRQLKQVCKEHGLKMEVFASDAIYCALDSFLANLPERRAEVKAGAIKKRSRCAKQ